MARVTTMLRTIDWRKFAAISAAVLLVLITTAAIAHTHANEPAGAEHCSLCLSAHNSTATTVAAVQVEIPLPVHAAEIPARSLPAQRTQHKQPYESRPPPSLKKLSA